MSIKMANVVSQIQESLFKYNEFSDDKCTMIFEGEAKVSAPAIKVEMLEGHVNKIIINENRVNCIDDARLKKQLAEAIFSLDGRLVWLKYTKLITELDNDGMAILILKHFDKITAILSVSLTSMVQKSLKQLEMTTVVLKEAGFKVKDNKIETRRPDCVEKLTRSFREAILLASPRLALDLFKEMESVEVH